LAGPQTQIGEPLWYKDAIIYEVHVKSFSDSTGDGIGDFEGLIRKLDYLRELGVTALWLLPFYPSPLLDDGYDISDYFHVHQDYGTLADFRRFLREAHRRGIRVITELVINHTSNQHKWFQRSRQSKPGSLWRDLYVWSDTTERYRDARIIFTDSESSNWAWDPVARAYYWHRFYSHQPDLNYDNPRVRRLMLRVLDFWFGMGVDGMRLDAVPYLFEREGTNCENLPETHAFLRELRAHVDQRFRDRMLLAEANQWPEDAAAYFGQGDECHMAFHFPIMPRLFMAVRMEDRFPVIDVLEQSLAIPPTCQWAMFLRNHDELTLEMVTDEERDYMYRAYAKERQARINVGIRRRLAPLLNDNRRLIELMDSLLLSLPGTPILYYGDEIGMGDNFHLGDRNGVRTPMQWTPDRNAGFSTANPQALFLPVITDPEYHYTTVNVETQSGNLSSLLWFTRRILAVRKRFRAFGRGHLEFLPSDNNKVLTYLRHDEDECLLVVANLSRYCQAVHIQMPGHAGCQVRDVFSDNRFPDIGETPYILTLGPHTFYWFALAPPETTVRGEPERSFDVHSEADWDRILDGDVHPQLLAALRAYARRARWFGGKGLTIRTTRIADHLTLPTRGGPVYLLLLEITYASGVQENYALPIALAAGDLAAKILQDAPAHVLAHLHLRDQEGILYDAVLSEDFHQALLQAIARGRSRKMEGGHLLVHRGSQFGALLGGRTLPIPSALLKAEQSNSSIVYQDTFVFKLYRRVEEGINPDVELPRHLTEEAAFTNTAAYAGSLAWQRGSASAVTLALLVQFVPNQGDAWSFALDNIDSSLGQALTLKGKLPALPELPAGPLAVDPEAIAPAVRDFIGPVFLELMSLLGRRTGELHLALMSLSRTPDVTPEPFSLLYQKSLYQSIRGLTHKVLDELEGSLPGLDSATAEAVQRVLAQRKTMVSRIHRLLDRKIQAMKIRTHGDYHLGQVLYTGKDFVVIDFEGEPVRSLTERRLKQSALRDVAGMVRSLHYAAQGSLLRRAEKETVDLDYLRYWADLWYVTVSGVFLHAYRRTVSGSRVVPADATDFHLLLETFILEKAVYELGYELRHRPDWLKIPVRGIEQVLK
jgi:maltose alpha-D-glucosyltransferase/alpha-amylase